MILYVHIWYIIYQFSHIIYDSEIIDRLDHITLNLQSESHLLSVILKTEQRQSIQAEVPVVNDSNGMAPERLEQSNISDWDIRELSEASDESLASARLRENDDDIDKCST